MEKIKEGGNIYLSYLLKLMTSLLIVGLIWKRKKKCHFWHSLLQYNPVFYVLYNYASNKQYLDILYAA